MFCIFSLYFIILRYLKRISLKIYVQSYYNPYMLTSGSFLKPLSNLSDLLASFLNSILLRKEQFYRDILILLFLSIFILDPQRFHFSKAAQRRKLCLSPLHFQTRSCRHASLQIVLPGKDLFLFLHKSGSD